MIQFELNLVLKDDFSYSYIQKIRQSTANILNVPGRDIELGYIEMENEQKKNDTATMLTFLVKFKIHSLSFVVTKNVLKILYSEKFYSDLYQFCRGSRYRHCHPLYGIYLSTL